MDIQTLPTLLIVGKVKTQTPLGGEHWYIQAVGRKHMREKYRKLEQFGSTHSKNINSGKLCKRKYPASSYKNDPKDAVWLDMYYCSK